MSATVMGIIFVIVILFLFTLIKKDGKFAHLGINLSRIYCPKCNEKQPIIRNQMDKDKHFMAETLAKNAERKWINTERK